MLSFSSVRRIFVARAPQDMRRGIDTLASVVEHELGHEPYTGDCFIFLSRDRKKLKVLSMRPTTTPCAIISQRQVADLLSRQPG